MRIGSRRKQEARKAYEEGGKAMGRQIMHDPSAEARLWKMLSGLGLWPRWYLSAFRRLYEEENPQEYERVRKANYRKRKRKQERAGKLKKLREGAARTSPQKPESQHDCTS